MNVKKMTTEHLLETIQVIRGVRGENAAQDIFLLECEKELKRRWGIKG